MNQQLKSLYEEYFLKLKEHEFPEKTSAPLFMSIFDEYYSSTRKILIVGQETNGWMEMDFDEHSVDSLMKDYQNFGLGQNRNFKEWDYKDGKKPRDYLTSPFWNFSRRFFSIINDDIDRRQKGFLWTNISKFDIDTRTPDKEHYHLESFELLRKEVQIIKPNVVLFLTGVYVKKPKYDEVIEEILKLRFSLVDSNPLVLKLNHKDDDFPENTFKIDHPRYLQSIKKNREVLGDLIEYLKPL